MDQSFQATINNLIWIFGPLHLLFQLAFFYYIGPVMLKQRKQRVMELQLERYNQFKKWARFFIYGSAVTFVLAVLISFNTLLTPVPYPYLLVGGVVLIGIGLSARYMAYQVIGEKGYYCYNFFKPPEDTEYIKEGIYKFLDNPIYSLGYLPAFGFPLVMNSMHGIVLAIADWIIIFSFYYLFEHQHTEEVVRNDYSKTPGEEEGFRKAV